MRVAAEPPFRTSLCYRVRHDTDWQRLGEEYASELGRLVDSLYSADQYSQQATLVDLLRR